MPFQITLFCKNSSQNRRFPFFVSLVGLLTILGLVIICYDDDLTDDINPPVLALRVPFLFDYIDSAIELLSPIYRAINQSIIEKASLPTRSPPYQF